MRLTKTALSAWKDAATVMLLARNRTTAAQPQQSVADDASDEPGQNVSHFDYKVLMLERSTKSKFMPSAYVFPGGMVGAADSSDAWNNVFKQAGVGDLRSALPPSQQPPAERAPMFLNDSSPASIPADVALRITSIRECFEECGILLFRKAADLNSSKFTFDKKEINSWRSIVSKEDYKFADFCLEFSIVPDIWSLKEWNCWLTPTNMPAMHSGRRYDTAFYLCCLEKPPDSVHDEQEIVSSRWMEPAEVMHRFKKKEGWIAPPQIYELSRLCAFQKYADVARFSDERSPEGCERWLPVRTNCDDGLMAILPGDDLYPEKPDILGEYPPPSVKGSIADNLQNSDNLHRFEMRSTYDVILQSNVKQKQGHCAPMSERDILNKFPY